MVTIRYSSFLSSIVLVNKALATPLGKLFPRQGTGAQVKVTVENGNIIGVEQSGIESFTGIPFADSPVGDLRLKNPQAYPQTYDNFDATRPSPACPQQKRLSGSNIPKLMRNVIEAAMKLLSVEIDGQEDCLTLDIHRPANIDETSSLPVMLYIFGGAFITGSTDEENGKNLVSKSVGIGTPIIYISINYRLGAFGFLGGKQVSEAGIGNLGLKDQRLAMEWVQKNIQKFGGDPTKVTLAGHSAGSISVSHHMYAFGGQTNDLFRAAICVSGTALPTGKLSEGSGQARFDAMAKAVGCEGDSDPVACLRKVDYQKFLDAQNSMPGMFAEDFYPLGFAPFVDGEIVPDTLSNALAQGKVAQIPLITGTVDDEGTVLTLGQLTIDSGDELKDYLKRVFPKLTEEQIDTALSYYKSEASNGVINQIKNQAPTKVFQQFAALLGDYAFQARRRMVSRALQTAVPTWGYNDDAKKDTPILGAYHGSEKGAIFEDPLQETSRGDEYQRRFIAFVNNLNPNVDGLATWDNYGSGTGKLLKIVEKGSDGMISDDYRAEAMDFLIQNEASMMF